MLTLSIEDPLPADLLPLLEEADRRSASLYPAECRHGLTAAELTASGCRWSSYAWTAWRSAAAVTVR